MYFLISLLHAVISVSVVLLVSVWSWYQWRYRKLLGLARTLPTTLPTLPLLGHVHHFQLFGGVDYNASQLIRLLTLPVDGTSCTWLGPVPLICVNRAEDVKRVLNCSKALGKGKVYHLVKFLFGNGMLTAPVHIWKKTQKHIRPVLHVRNLYHFVPHFNETSRQLAKDLAQHVGRGHVDVMGDLHSYSLKSIYSVLFGPDVRIADESRTIKDYLEVIKFLAIAATRRILRIWEWSDPVFGFLHGERMQTLVDTFKLIKEPALLKMVNEKTPVTATEEINEWEIENSFPKRAHVSGPVTLPDVFHVLRRRDASLGHEYMGQEIQTLLITGTDTLAVTLASCLVVLGSHPHIQEKLYNEIVEQWGEEFQSISMEDVKRMVYLDQVLKETMRRFTLVPVIVRRTEEDIELSDCTIPAGSEVVLPLVALHMNPNIFPNPTMIDPDRFALDNADKREAYTFLPFSGGPRDCIGKHYAMVVMKMTMVHILRAYSVSSDVNINKMKFTYGLSLFSSDGYKVELRRRK